MTSKQKSSSSFLIHTGIPGAIYDLFSFENSTKAIKDAMTEVVLLKFVDGCKKQNYSRRIDIKVWNFFPKQ